MANGAMLTSSGKLQETRDKNKELSVPAHDTTLNLILKKDEGGYQSI
jgi:hypothetical protein